MFISNYRIRIKNLSIPAKLGVFAEEKGKLQQLIINVELKVFRLYGDYYQNVVCYRELTEELTKLAVERHWELLETLANEMVNLCLANKQVQEVEVTLAKPEALQQAEAAEVIMAGSQARGE